MGDLAPIVMFVFARPDHTRRTLDALRANTLAAQSELVVYADGARTPAQEAPVRAVRELVRAASGFRSVRVVERPTNVGLATNIIEGVGEVCGTAGRVIVLEDDMVTSPAFLSFMNAALDRYAGESRVHHICGWNYPIDASGLGDAFLWQVMNCWGWATWADRWRHYTRDPERLVRTWSRDKIRRFNLDGAHDFWAQVLANHRRTMRTWAIFWGATIFDRGGLCVNASRSLVDNIGQDGSGEHFSGSGNVLFSSRLGDAKTEFVFPDDIRTNALAVARVQEFYRRTIPVTFHGRALAALRRLLAAYRAR